MSKQKGFLLMELLVSAGVCVIVLTVIISYVVHLQYEYQSCIKQLALVHALYAPIDAQYRNAQLEYTMTKQSIGLNMICCTVVVADKQNKQVALEGVWLEL